MTYVITRVQLDADKEAVLCELDRVVRRRADAAKLWLERTVYDMVKGQAMLDRLDRQEELLCGPDGSEREADYLQRR